MTEHAAPSWPTLEELRDTLAAAVHGDCKATGDDRGRVDELLAKLRLPELLEALAVAERIVTAADGFHPVASFFVEGSPERRFIVDVLRRSGRW